MQLRKLVADDDAVSPVIGVILMVAITVILAAVIGTFVLGLGGQVSDSAPSANFQFDTGSHTITHNGGDPLDPAQIKFKDESSNTVKANSAGIPGTWTAGTSTDDLTTHSLTGGDTVQIIWMSPSSGDTAIIGSGEI